MIPILVLAATGLSALAVRSLITQTRGVEHRSPRAYDRALSRANRRRSRELSTAELTAHAKLVQGFAARLGARKARLLARREPRQRQLDGIADVATERHLLAALDADRTLRLRDDRHAKAIRIRTPKTWYATLPLKLVLGAVELVAVKTALEVLLRSASEAELYLLGTGAALCLTFGASLLGAQVAYRAEQQHNGDPVEPWSAWTLMLCVTGGLSLVALGIGIVMLRVHGAAIDRPSVASIGGTFGSTSGGAASNAQPTAVHLWASIALTFAPMAMSALLGRISASIVHAELKKCQRSHERSCRLERRHRTAAASAVARRDGYRDRTARLIDAIDREITALACYEEAPLLVRASGQPVQVAGLDPLPPERLTRVPDVHSGRQDRSPLPVEPSTRAAEIVAPEEVTRSEPPTEDVALPDAGTRVVDGEGMKGIDEVEELLELLEHDLRDTPTSGKPLA